MALEASCCSNLVRCLWVLLDPRHVLLELPVFNIWIAVVALSTCVGTVALLAGCGISICFF